MPVTVTEPTPTTGVEITGLTGDRLVDRGVAEDCLAALDRRGVVICREADVDDDDLVAFSRLLGEVVPLPMGGRPAHREIQDIEAACSFLVSEQAGYITGQVIGVNGGRKT